MKALWLRMAMCAPMYLFEHHLACDLVFRELGTLITLEYLGFDLAVHPWEPEVAP